MITLRRLLLCTFTLMQLSKVAYAEATVKPYTEATKRALKFFEYGDKNGDGQIDVKDMVKQGNMAWLSELYRLKEFLPDMINDPYTKEGIKKELWVNFYQAKGKLI